MKKEDLVLALLNEGVEGLMEIEIPEFDTLPAPVSDDEVANSFTIATYCNNCNIFLQIFSGLKIFDYLLRGLQRSNPMIALAMASLEGSSQGEKRIEILQPNEGSESHGAITFLCRASADITGIFIGGLVAEPTLMEYVGSYLFRLVYIGEARSLALIFRGETETEESDPIERSCTLLAAPTVPTEGSEYNISAFPLEISISFPPDAFPLIYSCTAQIDAGSISEMQREAEDNFIAIFASPGVGPHTISFHIYPSSWDDFILTINFTVVE
jgi:hypothetical protein